ncbi:DUF2569 family protein [Paenibacillus sp. 481]|uniref:DUF2569 family protein n=1 Tax=Paenibacillus sp. 481 TaxID=2835869 RepID=UPI001E6129F9|nr:DUF2569 family protein [Paenibacillus sp. 481]UHA71753.1 DUF2569 family protein [Paenibacillus sp. 481]
MERHTAWQSLSSNRQFWSFVYFQGGLLILLQAPLTMAFFNTVGFWMDFLFSAAPERQQELVPTLDPAYYTSTLATIVVITSVFQTIVNSIFSIVNFIFFFRRKKIFPHIYIGYLLFTFIMHVVTIAIYYQTPDVWLMERERLITWLIVYTITCLIGIPYFLFSKWVKVVFIR